MEELEFFEGEDRRHGLKTRVTARRHFRAGMLA